MIHINLMKNRGMILALWSLFTELLIRKWIKGFVEEMIKKEGRMNIGLRRRRGQKTTFISGS